MVKIGIVGGTGYTGVELLRILASHPDADVRAITSRGEAGTRVVDMFPSLRGKYDKLVVHRARRHGLEVVRRRVLRHAARRGDGAGARARRRRRQDHRPRRRLPHPRRRALREVVQAAARVPRPPRGVGVRPARVPSRRDQARRASSATRAAIRRRCSSGFVPLLEAGIVDSAAPHRRLQVGRVGRRAARRRSACCSPRPRTTSRPTACRAIAIIRRPCRSCQGRSKTPVELVFTPHLLPMIRGIHVHAVCAPHEAPTSTCRRCSRSATRASRSST